jgi:hypothetical protein
MENKSGAQIGTGWKCLLHTNKDSQEKSRGKTEPEPQKSGARAESSANEFHGGS